MNSLILTTATRLLSPLLIGFSVYMLLRGHNAPGGGFIGGLIAASAVVMQVFAYGVAAARAGLRVDPRSIGVAGFGCALISGVISALYGQPPLTGIWGEVAGIPVSTVLLFDIGVYLAVFGAMLTLVFAIEEQG